MFYSLQLAFDFFKVLVHKDKNNKVNRPSNEGAFFAFTRADFIWDASQFQEDRFRYKEQVPCLLFSKLGGDSCTSSIMLSQLTTHMLKCRGTPLHRNSDESTQQHLKEYLDPDISLGAEVLIFFKKNRKPNTHIKLEITIDINRDW